MPASDKLKKIGRIEGFPLNARHYGKSETLHAHWRLRLETIDRLIAEGVTHIAIGEGKLRTAKSVWKEAYLHV